MNVKSRISPKRSSISKIDKLKRCSPIKLPFARKLEKPKMKTLRHEDIMIVEREFGDSEGNLAMTRFDCLP